MWYVLRMYLTYDNSRVGTLSARIALDRSTVGLLLILIGAISTMSTRDLDPLWHNVHESNATRLTTSYTRSGPHTRTFTYRNRQLPNQLRTVRLHVVLTSAVMLGHSYLVHCTPGGQAALARVLLASLVACLKMALRRTASAPTPPQLLVS